MSDRIVSKHSDAGKGDDTRPRLVSREEYYKNHDRIFGAPSKLSRESAPPVTKEQ